MINIKQLAEFLGLSAPEPAPYLSLGEPIYNIHFHPYPDPDGITIARDGIRVCGVFALGRWLDARDARIAGPERKRRKTMSTPIFQHSAAEVEISFQILAQALANAGWHVRHAGEFMLMHRCHSLVDGALYAFKHRATHDYAFALVLPGQVPSLHVPQRDEPFMRGVFLAGWKAQNEPVGEL